LRQVIAVLAVFAVIALMLISSIVNARFGENENKVKSTLRLIYEAAEVYRKVQRPASYPQAIEQLTETKPPLIEPSMLVLDGKGYRIIYERTREVRYRLKAVPKIRYLTGYRSYYLDETGIIRLNNSEGDPVDA
jgi:type II secretory pathway pseudopilin PulG